MKTIMTCLILLFVLSGCATTTPTVIDQSTVVVITPPETLFNCPQIKKSDIPDADTLTNQEIANFIEKYETNLRTCGINMAKIKEYIVNAKANLETNVTE